MKFVHFWREDCILPLRKRGKKGKEKRLNGVNEIISSL